MAENYPDSEKNKLLANFEKQVEASGKKWAPIFRDIRRARRLLEGEIPENVPSGAEGAGILDSSGDPIESDSGTSQRKKVRANLLQGTNEAMLPLVYARNPDVSVRPSEKVASEGPEYQQTRRWAETLEIVISHQLSTGGLKKQAKKATRSVQAAKVGWLKVSYQRDYGQDPEILNRMNDAQENLASIQGKIANMAEGEGDSQELELEGQQLRQQIEGLEQTPEVVRSEGIVVDHIPTEHMRMDPSVSALEDYQQADWIAHYTDIPVTEYRERFNVDDVTEMRGVKVYTTRSDGQSKDAETFQTNRTGADPGGDVRLWELWNRSDNTVYNWAEGAMDFCREPWVPQGLGQRWYPFFCFGFHWIDGKEWPQSVVDMLEGLQQEYNDTREQKNEHRKANVPHYIAAGEGIDPKEVESFAVAGAREVVVLNAQGRPLREIIAPSPQIQMNPQMYDTQATLFDIQWVSGLQDAARGGVRQAKTLGEAEIAENHLASRASNYQDEMEEMLTEMAQYVAQMLLLKMERRMVFKIAGENAIWPEMPRSDVFEMFQVEIRAGSTGKPDQRAEQETWTELLPHLVPMIEKIMVMRQQGMPDASNPLVKILEESLKRFDERLDLEAILPPMQQPQQAMGMAGQPQPGMQPDPSQQPAQPPPGGNGGAPPGQQPGF